MPLIRAFRGLRPAPGRAEDVLAPPYDVLSTEEARERARDRPWSFLHISKPEIDLPPQTDPYRDAVYAKAAENLRRMIEAGVLVRDPEPRLYVYRLRMGGHVQTGIVAVASVSEYERNRIRKHEFTRPVKEDDRVRQIEAVNAQTGPVLLAHPDHAGVERALDEWTRAHAPVVDVEADDGVQHSLWVIDEPEVIRRLEAAFDAMPALYIADGHHRSAAAARVAARRRAQSQTGGAAEASHEYFLSVIFPARQMRILDYNRVVRDLNGMDPERFLARVRERFEVVPSEGPVRPDRPATFGMYVDGRWYRLRLRPEHIPADDPVRRLDVSLLQENLLAPVLGIGDPRTDERIDFVGGIRGLEALERRVDSGEMAVAFSLYPTRMADLMAVADAGEVMPPKSTWFEPKLADGLVSHVLD